MDIAVCSPLVHSLGRGQWLMAHAQALRWLLAAFMLASAMASWAQSGTRDYDHARSGFPLTGRHVAARCESCHTGGVLKGTPRDCESCHTTGARLARDNVVKPRLHLPSPLSCESCHNTRGFSGARFNHVGVTAGTCESCHNGQISTGKNAAHVATQSSCETCHRSTRSWTSAVSFFHTPETGIGSGTCDACHNGAAARGRPGNHIPVAGGLARCDSCHRSQARFSVAVTMNHGVVGTTSCKSCHNGAFVSQGPIGARAKPGNHIPESALLNGAAMDCNSCHTSTASFSTQRMDHNGSMGRGAGTCKTCHQTGARFLGNMEQESLNHESRNAAVIDCSDSGCHRPLGRVGSTYTRWD